MNEPLYVSLTERPTFALKLVHKKQWPTIAFSVFWLSGWGYAWCLIGNAILGPRGCDVITILWFLMWTLGGLYIIYYLAWSLFGFESLTMNSERLTVNTCIGPWTRKKTYALAAVSEFRVFDMPWKNEFMHRNIAFRCGSKTCYLGICLDKDESQAVAETLEREMWRQRECRS